MRISTSMVYLTDNGAAYCGEHLGATAKATGCDLSGQPILPLTPEMLREMGEEGQAGMIRCEHPHCGRQVSLPVEVTP